MMDINLKYILLADCHFSIWNYFYQMFYEKWLKFYFSEHAKISICGGIVAIHIQVSW
jgi:hypothetical protein